MPKGQGKGEYGKGDYGKGGGGVKGKGKGDGKGKNGKYPVRPSNLSIEERRKKLKELK